MGQLDRAKLERMERELRNQASDLLRRAESVRQQALAIAEEANRLRQQLGPVFV